MKTKRNVIAVASIAALILAGCSGKEETAKGDDGAKVKEVVVLTHDSFNVPKELIEEFEKETGYKLVTQNAGDAGVANQLVLTKNNGTYDAVYGIDNYTAGIVQKENVLLNYSSEKLPDSAKQYLTDGLTPIDVGDVCINVDHSWFTANSMPEPQTLDDLAKPEYAKLLTLINPADSTTGFAFLAGVHTDLGEEGATKYFTSVIGGGAKVAAGWSEAYYEQFSAGDGKGNYPLVLSYASSPAETKGATGAMKSTCVRQVEYAGVVDGGKNEKGAKAFVDFMLSAKVQGAIPGSMYMYPVDSSVALPEEWAKYATLMEKPIIPDIDQVNENRDKWLKNWASIVQK